MTILYSWHAASGEAEVYADDDNHRGQVRVLSGHQGWYAGMSPDGAREFAGALTEAAQVAAQMGGA